MYFTLAVLFHSLALLLQILFEISILSEVNFIICIGEQKRHSEKCEIAMSIFFYTYVDVHEATF